MDTKKIPRTEGGCRHRGFHSGMGKAYARNLSDHFHLGRSGPHHQPLL